MIKFTIRELKNSDFENGFFETLSNLSQIGSINHNMESAERVLKTIRENNTSRIYVAESDDGQIIGSITLFLEQKFIHNGGKVGHIEDVVTRKEYSGQGIGSALLQKCVEVARKENCYKVILDCSQNNIPFYEKAGFREYEVSMRYDIESH
jgi:glucosamine-phosphate N-acetyltransferase